MTAEHNKQSSSASTNLPLVLGALFLGGLLMTTNRTLLYPLLDVVSIDLALSSAQAGSIASIYFLFLIISQFVAGSLVDRLGYKRIIIGLYLLGGLATLGTGLFARDYFSLVFFTALQGLGLGVYWPVAHGISILSVPEKKRGLASAIVNGGIAGGHGVGLVLSSWLFTLTGSWRFSSLVVAVPTILLVLGFVYAIPNLKPLASKGERTSWLSIIKDRSLLSLYLVGFTSLYCFWTVIVWGPTYLQSEIGFDIASSGWLTAMVTAIAIPAGIMAGSLSDRLGRRRIALVMMAAATLIIAVIANTKSPALLLAMLAAYGIFGEFSWAPVRVAWWADFARTKYPHSLGLVLAAGSIISMGSSVIGPVLSGGIRDATNSLKGGFYIAVFFAVIGTLMILRSEDPTTTS